MPLAEDQHPVGRPIAIGIRMEEPFSPLLQHSGHRRLRNTVSDGRDGRFILPLRQPRPGMFRVDVDLCGQAVR